MSETTLVLPGGTAGPVHTEAVIENAPPGVTVSVGSSTSTLPDGAVPLADAEPELEEPDGQAVVFDASEYRLDIPVVDGVDAERIVVGFAGSVELDLNNSDDLAMFNSLTLGREVDLRVAGVVADKASPLRVDKETGEVTMVRKAKVSVHTLHVLAPEELA